MGLIGKHAAKSHDTPGVQVQLVDGSLRSINDDVASRVWWKLGTRTGTEITDGM